MPSASLVFPHGFKAQCQRKAAAQRALLSVTPADRLDPRLLAEHHGIDLLTPAELPSLSPGTWPSSPMIPMGIPKPGRRSPWRPPRGP